MDGTSFRDDYSEGAHPSLLQALASASAEQNAGYGLDRHSLRAAELIRARLGGVDADVHFLSGGTQANLVAIASFLRPHQAAIAAHTAHIATHETGAIEATGHKVLTVASGDGKLSPASIRPVLREHGDEHMVQPKLVYVSHSTEVGTIYTLAELQALSAFCRENGLLLFLDGARLAAALTAEGNDLALADIAALCDAFYIGGTKNGALAGEALVVCNPALKPDLRYQIKQRGAMLAKGMFLGAQFEALFDGELFFELARHANAMAARLRDALSAQSVAFLADSPTNQLFPILPAAVVEALEARYAFHRWQAMPDGGIAIRLVASWATKPEAVDSFITDAREALTRSVRAGGGRACS
jgi:threonine aldolase